MDAEAMGTHGCVPVFWVYDKNQFARYNAAFQNNANSVRLDLRTHPCDTAEEMADAVRSIRGTLTGPYTLSWAATGASTTTPGISPTTMEEGRPSPRGGVPPRRC